MTKPCEVEAKPPKKTVSVSSSPSARSARSSGSSSYQKDDHDLEVVTHLTKSLLKISKSSPPDFEAVRECFYGDGGYGGNNGDTDDDDVTSCVSGSVACDKNLYHNLLAQNLNRREFPHPQPKQKNFSKTKTTVMTRIRKTPLNFFPNSLGCEVGALDSIKQHLFHAELEFDPRNKDSVRESEEGNQNRHRHPVQDATLLNAKIQRPNPMLLNFTRHVNDEIEVNPGDFIRLSVLSKHQPQPLYLTGNNRFQNLIKSDYALTRYANKLKIEPKKKARDNENDENGEEEPGSGKSGKIPDIGIKASRQTYFDSAAISETRKLQIQIIDVNQDDTIQVFITDEIFEQQYINLSKLMYAYYDVTLTRSGQRQEMIPKFKIKLGMIVVVLLHPHGPYAKFIRARIMSLKPHTNTKNKEVLLLVTVRDVDAHDSNPYVVPLGQLFYIDESFMKLPFLANKYQLKGLSFFKGTGLVFKKFKSIVNIKSKHFSAIFSKPEATCSLTRNGVSTPSSVELFMGKGRTEQPVNYLFAQAVMKCLTPTVEPTLFTKAHLRHCDYQGNFWFSVENEILPKLQSYGFDIEKHLANFQVQTISTLSDDFFNDEVYITRSSVDGLFHRVYVTDICYAENKVDVQFCDWGNYEEVNVANGIYKARHVDQIYATIPAQALKVRILGVSEVRNPNDVMACLENVHILIKEAKKEESLLRQIQVCAFIENPVMGRIVRTPLKNFVQSIYFDSVR